MAFTQTQLESIENALVALAAGTRVVRVVVDGQTIEYGQGDMDKLSKFRDRVKAEILASAGRKRFVLTTTSKGF